LTGICITAMERSTAFMKTKLFSIFLRTSIPITWHRLVRRDRFREGKGYTVNVPLSYGMGDADYVCAFEEIFLPIARKYRPEIILVSAGFDIHHTDPLGGMAVTEGGFTRMTKMLMDVADEMCGASFFYAEGGYKPLRTY